MLFMAGCSYNSNQKLASPILGTVHNEYYIINIHPNDIGSLTNAFPNTRGILMKTASKEEFEHQAKVFAGKGNELFAIDNQVLIGHDFGNAMSNDVNHTASIPIRL